MKNINKNNVNYLYSLIGDSYKVMDSNGNFRYILRNKELMYGHMILNYKEGFLIK